MGTGWVLFRTSARRPRQGINGYLLHRSSDRLMGMLHPSFWQPRTPQRPVRIQITINTLLRWSTRATGVGLARETSFEPARLQYLRLSFFTCCYELDKRSDISMYNCCIITIKGILFAPFQLYLPLEWGLPPQAILSCIHFCNWHAISVELKTRTLSSAAWDYRFQLC